MKVLWVSLVEFPPLSIALGKTPPSHCGWMYSSACAALKTIEGLELGVAVYSYGSKYEKYVVDGITYYMIPTRSMQRVDHRQIESCRKAIEDFKPDLIHIHGTEHSLADAMCRANVHKITSIANIQGLAIPYTRYADGGLSLRDKLLNFTLVDLLRGTGLLNARRSFRNRAKCEANVLNQVQHVVGRTTWDRDHTLTVNPSLKYYFMNETLRDSFYETPRWSLDKCVPHSVFVSNSNMALKGAHQVLRALPIILRKYPDTQVRFCGCKAMSDSLNTKLRMQGYHLYLRRLVKKMGLEKNVAFLGSLSEVEMKQEFLNANVYVLPSAIENSPNSLCEAQILGVPVISSYVGGVSDLVEDGKTGFLYRYEEYEQLAQRVIELFETKDFTTLSGNEMAIASARHNRDTNAAHLAEIYRTILS